MEALQALAIVVAITIGITEVIKLAFKLPTRFIPFVSVLVGIVVIYIGDSIEYLDSQLLTGIVVGLISSGLFDQKMIIEGLNLTSKLKRVINL